MSTAKVNKTKNKQNQSLGNPFVKLVEDKIKVSKAVQEGKALSTLKDIDFVKPV